MNKSKNKNRTKIKAKLKKCERCNNNIDIPNDENEDENIIHEYICKSTVLSKYHLKKTDINHLIHKSVNNPHYKTAHEMMLYKLCDIKNAFNEKYGTIDSEIEIEIQKFDEIKDEDKKTRALRRENILREKENNPELLRNKNKLTKIERKILLEYLLNKQEIELRDDSKLCSGYINGSIKHWKIDNIVQRMCQMKYLFDYCNMDKYIRIAKNNQQKEYNAGYFPDTSIMDDAEELILKNIGNYPKVWPWLQKK